MRPKLQRLLRFLGAGLAATLVTYVVFIGALKVANYAVAATISWCCGLAVGFVLNRRFTFDQSGYDGLPRHLLLFVLGSGLQYAITLAGYAVLIGRLHVTPTLAFALNLILTSSFSFGFQKLVVFRSAD